MALFKEKISAKSLATILMVYTITGGLDTEDERETFALGPHGWPSDDGPNVLPETKKRKSWKQLSGKERFKRPMEICFLRGWAISFIADRLVKSQKVRDAVFYHYASFWDNWSDFPSLREWCEGTKSIYDHAIVISDLEAGRNPLEPTPWSDAGTDELLEEISNWFVKLCDFNENHSDKLRAELKEEGYEVAVQALASAAELFQHIQSSHKITT